MEQIRVLLADNKSLFREGLARLLESDSGITVVCECTDGRDLIERARETAPDVVLVDRHLPECNSLEVAQLIRESFPHMRVAILDASDDEGIILSALGMGATGYIDSKQMGGEELLKSIELIAEGEVVLSGSLTPKIAEEQSSVSQDQKGDIESATALSDREIEIAKLVGEGATNKEIAQKLVLSENTVKVHIRNILEKLGLRNKQQIAAYAARRGWLPAPDVDLQEP